MILLTKISSRKSENFRKYLWYGTVPIAFAELVIYIWALSRNVILGSEPMADIMSHLFFISPRPSESIVFFYCNILEIWNCGGLISVKDLESNKILW